MHIILNKLCRVHTVSRDEVTLDVLELLRAHSTHICTSRVISSDLLRASLTPPYTISMLQWVRESADLERLLSLISDERGRAGPRGACQRVLWPGCDAAPSPQPAVDAPAKSAPATQLTFPFSPILERGDSASKELTPFLCHVRVLLAKNSLI